jgi:hypothetical protein
MSSNSDAVSKPIEMIIAAGSWFILDELPDE